MNKTAFAAAILLAATALAHATEGTASGQPLTAPAPTSPAATAAPAATAKTAPAASKAAASAATPKAATTATAPKATSAASKAESAKAKKAAAAEAAVVEKFISLQDAAIATFMELGSTLRGVKDKGKADAAAPTVKMAGEQLCTIIASVEALGEPSEAAQQAIMARIANVAEKNEIVEQVMVPLLTLMMQEPPCYGSEALQTELSNLLANLQGAAGIDEEGEEGVEIVPLQEPDSDETAEAASSK